MKTAAGQNNNQAPVSNESLQLKPNSESAGLQQQRRGSQDSMTEQ